MINIKELLNADVGNANIVLSVTPEELKEFALSIIEEFRNTEILKQNSEGQKEDELLTQKQVIKYLNITQTTLWRWKKIGYLIPTTHIGNRALYSKDKLDAMFKTKNVKYEDKRRTDANES